MVYCPGITINGSWQKEIDAKSAGFITLMILQEIFGTIACNLIMIYVS
jgi:hypothetical protein